MRTQGRMDKKLTCLVFALGMSLLVSVPCALADDPALMGWWKFDGDALDSSGHDRHGTLQGSPIFGPGVFGQALALEANPDYVTIDGYKGILGTHAFSIAAWIQTTNSSPRAPTTGCVIPCTCPLSDSFFHSFSSRPTGL